MKILGLKYAIFTTSLIGFNYTPILLLKKQFAFEDNIGSIRSKFTSGDTIQGDFNGDGKQEYLWVVSARNRETMQCKTKQCKITARCSDKKIPTLVTDRDYDTGILRNEGDLNNDGADEISFDIWAEGAWSVCYVYSLRKNKWYQAVEPFDLWEGQDEETIRPDPEKPGNVIVKTWHFNDSIYMETKSVPIKYYQKKK